VEVVSNRNGWYINYSSNGVPTNSYGPMDGPISMVEALKYVATMLALDR
jgi:hypothetical protein